MLPGTNRESRYTGRNATDRPYKKWRMTDTGYPFSKEFEQQTHDCLAHLYDMTRLQQLPLAIQLLPNTPAIQRGQAFRHLIFKLIESLAPRSTTDIRSKEARVYHIIMWRYVDGLSNIEIGERLALSERQFYREHRRALQTMTFLLWEQVNALPAAPPAEISVQSEVQRIAAHGEQVSLDPAELCASVIEATQSLAMARQIDVTTRLASTLDPLPLNAPIVRQLLIVLMYQVLRRQLPGAPVLLSADSSPNTLVIDVELSVTETEWDSLQYTLDDHVTFQELLHTLDATLDYVRSVNEEDGFKLVLTLPVAQQPILIIDDNPDAISLLQRYLGDTYVSVAARHAEEGLQMARTLRPWIIVLDIMLPTMDGWELLQHLKNHPDTHAIPVLVCSVLDTPEMALDLGADGFLKKPPDQVEFLATLARWRS